MAVPAKNPASQTLPAGPSAEVLTPVQLAAAALFAKGYKPGSVAKLLAEHIYPHSKLKGDRLIRQTRMKLRRWRRKPEFMDAVYEASLRQIEYDTPMILKAITKQAKRGELKHAQWLLELTGRYTPKGDQATGNVTVVFAQGLPRPGQKPDAVETTGYEIEE